MIYSFLLLVVLPPRHTLYRMFHIITTLINSTFPSIGIIYLVRQFIRYHIRPPRTTILLLWFLHLRTNHYPNRLIILLRISHHLLRFTILSLHMVIWDLHHLFLLVFHHLLNKDNIFQPHTFRVIFQTRIRLRLLYNMFIVYHNLHRNLHIHPRHLDLYLR